MGMEGRRPLQGDVQICIEGRSDKVGTATATATAESSAARKALLKRRLLEGAAVHVVQLCLVVKHCHPRNFPHVNERLARDLSRVPNFHAARYGTRLRLAGMQPAARMKGTGVQAFLQADPSRLSSVWHTGTLGHWDAGALQHRRCGSVVCSIDCSLQRLARQTRMVRPSDVPAARSSISLRPRRRPGPSLARVF